MFDKIECKVHGIQADAFERICLPGSELTVLGKLATKESDDGTIKTGVCAAHIFESDLFDISDEPDSCRLRRIARMYDEDDDYLEWTEGMLEEWDHANREERAFLRGQIWHTTWEEKRMTDNEIIKALECAAEWFKEHGRNTNTAIVGICDRAVDLINRQKAEIKKLKKILRELKMEAEMVYKQRDALRKQIKVEEMCGKDE